MRYRDLCETRSWKHYCGRCRPCLIASPHPLGEADCVIVEADGEWGTITTGRAKVFYGYFVKIRGASGEAWLGEDRHSIRNALLQASDLAGQVGWIVLAIGLESDWRESGLSANSGYGYHPAYPDRAVHMLEPPPQTHSAGRGRP